MPPLGASLSDDQIAAALTYIRREWGHTRVGGRRLDGPGRARPVDRTDAPLDRGGARANDASSK